MLTVKKIKAYQKGLLFKNGDFTQVLEKGWHIITRSPFDEIKVDVVNERDTHFFHKDLDLIKKSALLDKDLIFIDLKDTERALVWIEGRFDAILGSGKYALWKNFKEVKVEVIDITKINFIHDKIETILNAPEADLLISKTLVEQGFKALLFFNGEYIKTLNPGKYAFWKAQGKVSVIHKDMRIQNLDLSGQEIMTKDKVTLRLNALLHYRITDLYKAVMSSDDCVQSLYREAQMSLRASVGTRDLSLLLEDKNTVADELLDSLKLLASQYGVEVTGFGIRDIILPGEMKELLNKVIEAKKVAEANLITRREEVAAMRNQANSAKMMESNPVLLKLKEFEVLEKISQNSKMQVLLSEKGLAEKVTSLI